MLLLVFLFNVGGYYIVFWGLAVQIDDDLKKRLDESRYQKNETIELKIPVTLPYPIYSGEFQRVDGRFEYSGEYYRLVKRKFQNDTLYVVCFRDTRSQQLAETMNHYIRLTQNFPGAKEKAMHLLSKLVKEFVDRSAFLMLHPSECMMEVAFIPPCESRAQCFLAVHSPPPKD